MKTNLVKASLVMSAVAALVACNQNPYPTGLIQNNEPFNRHQVPSPYTVEGPVTAVCYEGKLCKISLVGHVPAPGSAVLEFTNLPEGAVYDPITHLLTYTPSYSVVDISSDPSQTSKDLPVIGITVESDQNNVSTGSSTLSIKVNNTPRPLSVAIVSGNTSVNEGASLDQVVNISSPDFPNGPFHLDLDGTPEGTTVTAVSRSTGQFLVHYQPSASTVSVDDTFSGSSYVKKYSVKYNAFAPLGQTLMTNEWTVTDQRLPALITAPDVITQGLDVSFAIRADDLNSEIDPVITVDASSVPFGKLSVTPVQQTSTGGVRVPNSSGVNVRWTGLTAANLGTTTPIFFVVCVQSSKGQISFCTAKKTMVTLSATPSRTATEL